MIVIGPGDGLHLRLYDRQKAYGVQIVPAINAELLVHFADEDSSMARSLGVVELHTDVTVPFVSETDRPIVVRAVTRTPTSSYAESVPDRRLAPQTGAVDSTRKQKPYIALAYHTTHGYARVAVADYSHYARVRKVEIADDAAFTVNLKQVVQDVDAGVAGLTDENELPAYIDLVRGAQETGDTGGVAPGTNKYYVRIAHSYESTEGKTGATYKDKVNALAFSAWSDTLEIDYSPNYLTNIGGDTGAERIGMHDGIFLDPLTSGDLVTVMEMQLRPASRWIPGLVDTSPAIQSLSGRKVWQNQQVYGLRGGGGLGSVEPLDGSYAWPESRMVVYSELADTFKASALGLYRSANDAEPTRIHGYKVRSLSGSTGPTAGDPLLRIAPAMSGIGPTTFTHYFSSRIDFTLTGAISSSSAPVAIDLYGGAVPDSGTDATGIRGLRIDHTGGAVAGVGSLAPAATGGLLWAPQFTDMPTAIPAPNYTGWRPVAFVGTSLYTHDGSNWLAITGSGVGSTPRLDQILDPNTNKIFAMTNHNLEFAFLHHDANITISKYRTADPIYAPPRLIFHHNRGTPAMPEDSAKGDALGQILFERRLGTGYSLGGYLHTVWDAEGIEDFGNVTTLGVGPVGGTRVSLTHKTGLTSINLYLDSGNFFQVQTNGFIFSHGTTGSIYYKYGATTADGWFQNLDINPATDLGRVLTVTNVDIGGGVFKLFPRWQSVSAAAAPRLNEIQDPNASRAFNMGNHTLSFDYAATVAGADNFVVQSAIDALGTGCVAVIRAQGTASTKAPLRVEARNQLVFAIDKQGGVGVRSFDHGFDFNVQGTSRFVGPILVDQQGFQETSLYKHSDTPGDPFAINIFRARGIPTSAGDVIHGDTIGQIVFHRKITSGYAMAGYLVSRYHSTAPEPWGDVVELGCGPYTRATRIGFTDNGSVGSINLDVGVHRFQVQTAGFVFTHGTAGAIYHKDSGGYFQHLSPNPATDEGRVLTLIKDPPSTGPLMPRWMPPPTTGGGTPAPPSLSLQYNNAGAFGGITGVRVVAAGSPNLMMAGYLQLVASWTEPSTADIDQEFFISARKSVFEGAVLPARFQMRTFRDDNVPPFIQFERGRGTAGSIGLVQHADIVGSLRFAGHRGATNVDGSAKPTVLGSVIAYWDSSLGGRIRMSAMDGAANVECSDNGTVQAATIVAGAHFWQLSGAGNFRLSIGATGAVYYQSRESSLSKFKALETSGASDGWLLTLKPGTSGSTDEQGVLVPKWQPAGSGTVTPPLTLTYSTATDDNPTLLINHTQSSASAIAFAAKIWFIHTHAGSVTNGRRGLAVGWDQRASGGSTNGDAILNVYGQNNASLSLGSYHLMGLLIDSAFNTAVPTFTALRIKAPNATVRRAITVDILAGDVVIGGDVPNGQLHGYLYIPTSNGTPTTSLSGIAPSNTCALMFDRANNKLYANDGVASWIDLTPAGGGALPQGGANYIQYYSNSTTFGGISPSTAGGVLVAPSVNGLASFVTTFIDNVRLTFNPGSTVAGLNVGTHTGDPSSPSNGDIYYNSTSNKFRGYQSGWTDLIATASTPAGQLRGSKNLSNNALVDLLQVDFSGTPSTQSSVGGAIQMLIVAKGTASGIPHIFTHRRTVSFHVGHNANNDTTVSFSENTGDRTGGATDDVGLTTISHAINADAAVTMGTAVPTVALQNGIASNTVTYRLLAGCSLSLTQLIVYYTIIYHGEATITLL